MFSDSLRFGPDLAQARLELFDSRASGIDVGIGLGQRELIGRGIEPNQQFIRLDDRVVLDPNLDDTAGNFTGDLGDVSLDVGVFGGDVAAALQPEGKRTDNDEHRHADQRQFSLARRHDGILPLRRRVPRETEFRPATTAEPLVEPLAPGNQRLLDALQQCEQLLALPGGQIGKRGFNRVLGDPPDALVHPFGFGRQIDTFHAPVAGLGAAFDPAIGHQPVDHAAGGRLFDFHHLGEFGMRRPGPAVQAGQHQPLAAGDPEPSHAAIEFRPQQAGDVRDHDPNVFFGIRHGRPL